MRSLIVLVCIGCGGSGSDGGKDAPGTMDDSSMMQDGSTTDASFGPGAVCGAATCMSPQECCTGAMISCKLAADCPTQHFACDGPEDCNGGTCCFGNGGQMGSACKAVGQNCGEAACHCDTDCSGATPKCCPKMFTPSYGVCASAC